MKEPLRLCDGDELPSALRDAFRALEREAPSAEMVTRVQHALQALPAATPGVVAASALSTGKLLALSTMLVGTVASFVALRNSGPAPISAAPHSQPAAVAESATPSVDVPAPLSAESARSPAPSAPVASPERASAVSVSTRSPQQAPQEARASKRPKASASARSFAHASSRSSNGGSTPRPAQIAAPEPTVAPQEVASAPAHEGEAARAPSALDPDAAGAQASEARMLAQAKRLAASDPAAALRQTETLAAQYPTGLFIQERELLAIQLHRQLGHTALAEQLARQFQERYPRSLYRRALPP